MIQRPRLLLIDDDSQFRRLLLNCFRRHFFVMEASKGFEGYSRALTSRPDVVLLDLHMEGWSGIETLRTFRRNPQLATTPIVIVTADNKRKTVRETIQAGASDYVLKMELNPPELVTRVIHLLPQLAS